MFDRFARWASDALGSSTAFGLALAFVVGWAIGGVRNGFSDSWQLFMNTATTIATFLMVFLIQHTQNVHEKALHAKLDELIRAHPEASDELRGIEKGES